MPFLTYKYGHNVYCVDVASSSASSSSPLRPVCIEFMYCTYILFHCDLLVFVEPRSHQMQYIPIDINTVATQTYIWPSKVARAATAAISQLLKNMTYLCAYARARLFLRVCVCDRFQCFQCFQRKKTKTRQPCLIREAKLFKIRAFSARRLKTIIFVYVYRQQLTIKYRKEMRRRKRNEKEEKRRKERPRGKRGYMVNGCGMIKTKYLFDFVYNIEVFIVSVVCILYSITYYTISY